MFSQSATPSAKDLGGKVVIPAFFSAVARRFSVGRPQNYRMHTRGWSGEGRGTRALLQEWMFSWLQESRMNIYERPSRPGRGGWNLHSTSQFLPPLSLTLFLSFSLPLPLARVTNFFPLLFPLISVRLDPS